MTPKKGVVPLKIDFKLSQDPLHKINQAKDKELTELDLSYFESSSFGNSPLCEVPAEVFTLSKLQSLSLRGNKLENLPREIGQLSNLKTLDLSNNFLYGYGKLKHLPPEIGQLSKLQSLNLRGNQLEHLPPEIGQLSNLKELDLGDNQLKHLPSEIGQLSNLKELNLGGNQLEHLPPEIFQLSNLKELNLSRNKLEHLPQEIGQLTNLQKLIFAGRWGKGLEQFPSEILQLSNLQSLTLNEHELKYLPPEIGQLSNLQDLHLWGNKLEYIPSEIGQLSNLQKLELGINRLEQLPPEIGQLSNLQELILHNNKLEHLPPEIGQLSNLKTLRLDSGNLGQGLGNKLEHLPLEITQLSKLETLSLEGNPIKDIPPEIIGMSKAAPVFDYLKRLHHNTQPLNETKIIIVGEATTGKTSLIKRLKHNIFDKGETSTEGIFIESWQLEVNGSNIKANIWDFGGQELKHATHQFFFTKRTLYVLVLNVRQSEVQNRTLYWLKLITSFAPNSPILLVLNKIEESPLLHLDENQLVKEYHIQGFYHTSCATGEGIAELEAAIKEVVANMPHVFDKVPTSWLQVKSVLEANQDNFLSFSEYQTICKTKGITKDTEQRTLIRFLHDLGVVLNFSDDLRLNDTTIRNPQWVTKAIYAIIFSRLVAKQKGELNIEQLETVFTDSKEANPKDYPPNKWLVIIDIMRKFELCFYLEQDKKVLIPDLLPNNAPNNLDSYQKDALAFQYHYDMLPSNIISRLMVRLHKLIEGDLRWNSGMVLSNPEQQTKALVRTNKQADKLFIWVVGSKPRRREMLGLINNHLDHIHSSFAGIKVTPMIPLPNQPDKVISYKVLLRLESKGITQTHDHNLDADINVPELLNGIASQEDREVHIHQHFHGETYIDQRNSNITIEQLISKPQFSQELIALRDVMREQIPYGQGTEEQLKDLHSVEEAIEGAKEKDPNKVKQAFKQIGKWGFNIATDIGKSLLTEFLKKSVGL